MKTTKQQKSRGDYSLFTILFSLITLSVLSYANMTRTGNIVADSTTGLQWQDDIQAKTTLKTWTAAIDYCEALSLDTYNDWRLPNKKELLSIADYSRVNPSINPVFVNTTSDYYWSSTTDAGRTARAWIVYFYYGYTYGSYKTSTLYVRCVR